MLFPSPTCVENANDIPMDIKEFSRFLSDSIIKAKSIVLKKSEI